MFIPAALIGLATPVAINTTGVSSIINTQGLSKGAVGLTSDHAGTLSVQRYVDAAGTIPLAAAVSVAVVAATPISVGWADGLPCGSVIVSFINTAGAVANLTGIAVNLSA